jgi:hypothetical protein
MPAPARALKENLGGALGSKTSESFIERGDNEDSPTPLSDPEVASIQSSPCDAIPEPDHFTE